MSGGGGGWVNEKGGASSQVITVNDHDQIRPVGWIVVQNISPIGADLVAWMRKWVERAERESGNEIAVAKCERRASTTAARIGKQAAE